MTTKVQQELIGTTQELIDMLMKVKDKTLPIRLVNKSKEDEDEENIWAYDVEVSDTGQSGYEVGGEVRILGTV
jgi:hypothetical protein